jgi:hypothetical protein
MEHVNNIFQQLMRCICCCNGTKWTYLLPQVELAYAATRALRIEQAPFEASMGFSPEEPLDHLFDMQLSTPVSQDASQRLRLLDEVQALV